MTRKKFIIVVASLVTLGLLILLRPLDVVFKYVIKKTIKNKLPGIQHPSDVINDFVLDLKKELNFYSKLKYIYASVSYNFEDKSNVVDKYTKNYLLSTDFFYKKHTINKYLGYYDPYATGCANPLVLAGKTG